MAMFPGVTNDYWIADGLVLATTQHFARKLDGAQSTTNLRGTLTEVPGKPGSAVRHDFDLPDEGEVSFDIYVSDRDANSNQAGTLEARRAQVRKNVRQLLTVLSTIGRPRTLRHIDPQGRWWSASYRVPQKPRISYGDNGLWAQVTVTFELPGSYLVSETRTNYALIAGVNAFVVPGSNGPLADLTFTMPSAVQNSILSDQVGLSSIMHKGTQTGTWSVDVGAFTSVVGAASVIATTQTSGTLGGLLFSVLPGEWKGDGCEYKVYASKPATLWARGVML